MKTPYIYTVKNFRSRKLTTAITVLGVSLVVFVFAAVLMMANGVQQTLVSTGSPDNAMVLRKSSTSEISSIIPGDIQNVITTLPNIARTAGGAPIMSGEPVVVINLNKISGGFSNIVVRGVSPDVLQLRPSVRFIEGQMFNPALRELIVGESIAKRFEGAQLGKSIKFAGNDWRIVGIFSTGGSGFDSELWGDARQLQDAFNRGNSVSTLTLKMENPEDLAQLQGAFEVDRRLQEFEVKREPDFFAEQSSFLAGFIQAMGIFITIIFSIGAMVGAMITMYAAVANRTVEVGTLRALGFSRRSILLVFLAESLLIAAIGGAIGILLASFLQFFSISTLNFNSFSELAFSFALSPSIVTSSLIFALIMGFVGGFLPSVRAARLNIVEALRAG